MPQTQGHALANTPDQASQSPLPSDSAPHLPGESDPVVRRSSLTLFNGPILVMVIAVIGFALYQVSSLPQLAAFLHPSPSTGDMHNVANPGVVYWLPIVLVFSSATILLSMALTSLLARKRAGAHTAPRVGFAQPNALGIKPFRPMRREERHQAMETLRLRRDAKASEAARAAASERHVAAAPGRPRRVLEESLPSLPVHPQVRRRDPRKGLPRALAAALKAQLAAGPRGQSGVREAAAPPIAA